MQIAALDNDTIKLINTTQVITSVGVAVKELLENAFDANAKNIDITLFNAGSSLIQVKDDGTGISRENARSMALPAYTSKISNFSDLETLQTYGFRGEALAALCAVADVVVVTKTNEEDVAMTYELDHSGRIANSFSCHRSTGTTVQAKDLFKRIPVRRQLVTNRKKAMQEMKSLESLLKSYAICRFYTKLNCRVDGSTIFSKLPSNSLKESIGCVLGKKAIDNMTWLEFETTEISMQMMVPLKDTAEVSDVLHSGGQYIFVNDRPIQHKLLDKLITKTILDGLSQEISSRKKPLYVLRILLDPADVDVNVEPNKTSVFFKNQECILDGIETRLRTLYGLVSEEPQANEPASAYFDHISNQAEKSNTYLDNTCNNEREPLETPLPVKRRKLDMDCNINTNLPASHEETKKDSTEIPIVCTPDNLPQCSKENNLTSHILNLSGTDSEDNIQLMLSPESKNTSPCAKKKGRKNRSHSPLFELSQNVPSDVPETESESLSQLPVVDLGEDFDMALYNEKSGNCMQESSGPQTMKNEHDSSPKRSVLAAASESTTLESWSKGHIDGLKSGTNIESYVESYIRASQDSNALNTTGSQMQNLLPSNKSCAGLLKFLKDVTPQISRENPGLSIPQTVQKIIGRWKSLPLEERGYYRDIAKPLTKKEPKAELSPVDLQKNKARFLNMFEKMKTVNTQTKENVVMRTNVSWLVDMNKIRQNSKPTHNTRLLVGKLEPDLCVINHSAYLWVLETASLSKKLKGFHPASDEIDDESLEGALNQFLKEEECFSSLHPLHPMGED